MKYRFFMGLLSVTAIVTVRRQTQARRGGGSGYAQGTLAIRTKGVGSTPDPFAFSGRLLFLDALPHFFDRQAAAQLAFMVPLVALDLRIK
jgi:hypothetical protein